MKNHWLRMIIGCGLPLLFIFFAPLLGIDSNLSLFIFIGAMFAWHLLMPHGSHNHRNDKHSQHQDKNNRSKN